MEKVPLFIILQGQCTLESFAMPLPTFFSWRSPIVVYLLVTNKVVRLNGLTRVNNVTSTLGQQEGNEGGKGREGKKGKKGKEKKEERTSHPRIAHGQRYPMPCLEWLAEEVKWEQGSGAKSRCPVGHRGEFPPVLRGRIWGLSAIFHDIQWEFCILLIFC